MNKTALILATLVLAAGCATSTSDDQAKSETTPAPFAERDPKGFEACQLWDEYIDSDENEVIVSSAAGEIGKDAKTKAIRDTIKPVFSDETLADLRANSPDVKQIYLAHQEDFPRACTEAGYEFKNDQNGS